MTHTCITATKPSPSSKLGITFSVDYGVMKLHEVTDTSIFAGTGLKPGMQVTSINGTTTLGLEHADVRELLKSSTTEVEFGIFLPDSANLVLPVAGKSMPRLLELQEVHVDDWHRICKTMEQQLHPANKDCLELLERYKTKMHGYVESQMIRGRVGWGLESTQEKKMLEMTHQSAIAAQNAALVASSILALANALLNPQGIVAELVTSKHDLPDTGAKANFMLLPRGLKFSLIRPRLKSGAIPEAKSRTPLPDEC